MKPFFIKLILRIIATLIALFGIVLFLFLITLLLLPGSPMADNGFFIMEIVFSILLNIYFIYVGYLAWFRWSPMAVRHILGSLAFISITQIANIQSYRSTGPSDYFFWLEIAGFLIIYLLYQITARYCCRLLFPDLTSHDPIPKEANT